MSVSPKIVLIGAGSVAGHLGIALKKSKCTIIQVYSRTETSAKKLSFKLKASFTTEIKQLVTDADIYILAIKDDALIELVKQINFQAKLIVHTSGTMSTSVLNKFKNYGVLYPLQTFSEGQRINFSQVPFFIEANSKSNLKKIKDFASLLSTEIYTVDSKKRKAIHVSAVFACNFSNHMYAIAESILADEKIPFNVLQALIKETARKATKGSPAKLQTGPAMRNDVEVIQSHLAYLKKTEGFKKIYTLVSKSILDFGKQNGGK